MQFKQNFFDLKQLGRIWQFIPKNNLEQIGFRAIGYRHRFFFQDMEKSIGLNICLC